MCPTNELASPRATVDASGAMALLGDNADLYQQVAQAFLDELDSLPGQLGTLLGQANLTEVRLILHTFKGLSLTVGALALSDACHAAEVQLKTADPRGHLPDAQVLDAIHTDLVRATTATSQALQAALAELAQTAPGALLPTSQILDTTGLVDELQELRQLLIASDMRAVDVHVALRKRHAAAAGQQLDGLQSAMICFDFEQGVVQCSAVIRELRAKI